MKHQGARDRTRLLLSLGDKENKSLAIIIAHYGTSSPYDAARRAINEHANQIMEPVKQIGISLLTLGIIASLLASIYWFIAGLYPVGLLFVGAFLSLFITAIQITPKPPKICPHCGKGLENER